MLTDRDYMKPTPRSKIKIIVLPPQRRLATWTPKHWANALIVILALLIVWFVLSRVLG